MGRVDGKSLQPGDEAVYGMLTCLAPQWQVPSHVTVLCTTRKGGVSQAPFDSLNLGLHVGDDAQAVQENRRRLRDSFVLPGTPFWLNQTHSTNVVTAGESVDADGSWTQEQDHVLAVLTADCLPVVISNLAGTQIAVVHAGWRGLANGILENALTAFNASDPLHAWLGPAIGSEAFEVGEEVRAAFTERNALHASAFKPRKTEGKFLADLYALARNELQQARTVCVTGGEYCTFQQSSLFHSHRRDGLLSGRMATVAWIGA